MVLLFLKFFVVMMMMMILIMLKVKMKIARRNLELFKILTGFLQQPLCLQFRRFIVFYTNYLHFSKDYILSQWLSIAVTEDFSMEYKAFILSMVSHTFESWHRLLLSLEHLFFSPHLSNSNLTFNT